MAVKTKKVNTVKKVSRKKSSKPMITPDEFSDFVQKRAYYIWEEAGRPQGTDFDIWLKAEQDINEQFSVK